MKEKSICASAVLNIVHIHMHTHSLDQTICTGSKTTHRQQRRQHPRYKVHFCELSSVSISSLYNSQSFESFWKKKNDSQSRFIFLLSLVAAHHPISIWFYFHGWRCALCMQMFVIGMQLRPVAIQLHYSSQRRPPHRTLSQNKIRNRRN